MRELGHEAFEHILVWSTNEVVDFIDLFQLPFASKEDLIGEHLGHDAAQGPHIYLCRVCGRACQHACNTVSVLPTSYTRSASASSHIHYELSRHFHATVLTVEALPGQVIEPVGRRRDEQNQKQNKTATCTSYASSTSSRRKWKATVQGRYAQIARGGSLAP